MEADNHIILVSLLNLNTNLGLMFIEIEETIKNIELILEDCFFFQVVLI